MTESGARATPPGPAAAPAPVLTNTVPANTVPTNTVLTNTVLTDTVLTDTVLADTRRHTVPATPATLPHRLARPDGNGAGPGRPRRSRCPG